MINATRRARIHSTLARLFADRDDLFAAKNRILARRWSEQA